MKKFNGLTFEPLNFCPERDFSEGNRSLMAIELPHSTCGMTPLKAGKAKRRGEEVQWPPMYIGAIRLLLIPLLAGVIFPEATKRSVHDR